ncbi:HAD family hydrolase [Candidatus Nitrososphaera sp. FF02]|uniref:HAD family hydrolase n=1 Tax=Candidatus Nitrososphaera sp. FF02 TaxID=3398226 RepID=UPI0039EB63E7
MRPFVFFDLGQTLVSEWDFINYFDTKFLELLNGYGARIDTCNYRAVRDSIIRNRGIGHGSVKELVIKVCEAVLPAGYDNAVLKRIDPEVKRGRKELFRFADGAQAVLEELSIKCDLGIIANQSEDIVGLLQSSGFDRYFKVQTISGAVKMKKPDPRIFQLALKEAGRDPHGCIMVGDRLDTDVCPANRLGMKTVRVMDSLFALQEPREDCERPAFTVAKLADVPAVIERITG